MTEVIAPLSEILTEIPYVPAPGQGKEPASGTVGASFEVTSTSLLSPAPSAVPTISTLESIVGEQVTTFCFPFGGDHSFDQHTLSLLRTAGIDYCFSVESRDIDAADLVERRLRLPRHDCNAFPHGATANVDIAG
jgi:hypothetical protein